MSSRLEMRLRILVALCGFVGALFFPWWVPLVCMALLSIRFTAWEAPLIGLLCDLLWLPAGQWPLMTIAGILLAWGFEPLRRQLLLP